MAEDPFTVTVPADKKHLLKLVAAGLVLVPFGFLCAIFGWQAELPVPLIILGGYVLAPLGTISLVWIIVRLFSKKPALSIGREGILDNASLASVGMLKWEEIDHIHLSATGPESFLTIVPKEPESILSRQGPVKRLLVRANEVLADGCVNIPESLLPISLEEVLEQIRQSYQVRTLRQSLD